jgi:Holliday junction resolvase RusA-like endonuclease
MTDFFHAAIQPSLLEVTPPDLEPYLQVIHDAMADAQAAYVAAEASYNAACSTPYSPVLRFSVDGKPAPQGSKRVVGGRMGKNGKITTPHAIEANKRTRPWRAVVRDAAATMVRVSGWEITKEPVSVDITFYKQRPLKHYFTGKRADVLRDDAPIYCTTGPDIDKMSRAILDSMTDAKVYFDDKQVPDLHPRHLYADRDGDFPNGGVSVEVRLLNNSRPPQ